MSTSGRKLFSVVAQRGAIGTLLACAAVSTAVSTPPTHQTGQSQYTEATPATHSTEQDPEEPAENSIRVATIDSGLSRQGASDLTDELKSGRSPQADRIADAIRRSQADVVVLTNFDVDSEGKNLEAFVKNFLHTRAPRSDTGAAPQRFAYHYTDEVNAGIDSGADLNQDGVIGGPEDSLGYGEFPGQGGMMVLSTLPIDEDKVRTFTDLAWQDMPDSNIPDSYSDLERSILPLSTVAHWDIPLTTPQGTVHLLASAPQYHLDAAFRDDRAADELRFWRDYISGEKYITDDEDGTEAFKSENFVLATQTGLAPSGLEPDPAETNPNTLAELEELMNLSEVDSTHTSATTEQNITGIVLPAATVTVTGTGTVDIPRTPAGEPGTTSPNSYSLDFLLSRADTEDRPCLIFADIELPED